MATAAKNLSAFDPHELPDASSMRFGLVVSEWNGEITENLFKGAVEVLKACGTPAHQIERFKVPGAVELSYACKQLVNSERYDAVIAIGVVIQGETKHFDYVCQSVTHGITELNLQYDTPVIFCVLTDNNIQQSIDRSGGKHGNKGTEAGVAALKMAGLRRVLNP